MSDASQHPSTVTQRALKDAMNPVSDGRPDRPMITPLVMMWAVFFVTAGVVVYLCLLILRPFFGVAAWATVLATTCYPLHQRLVRHNGRVALSAFLTSALMVLAVLVPIVFIAGVRRTHVFITLQTAEWKEHAWNRFRRAALTHTATHQRTLHHQWSDTIRESTY